MSFLQFVHTTPLLRACAGGHTRTASLLIEAGANVNYKDEVIYMCSEEAIQQTLTIILLCRTFGQEKILANFAT